VLTINGNGSDAFTGSFAGDFNPSLTLTGFAAAALDVNGNFRGSFLAPTVGTLAAPIDHVAIGGSMLAASRIKVNFLSTLTVGGDLNGTIDGYGSVADPTTQFTIGAVTVNGGAWGGTGTITAPSIRSINMQSASSFAGHATETMPGADFQTLVLGTVTSTGVINAGAIVNASISGDMAGQIIVIGAFGTLSVGGKLGGSVSAATIGRLWVGQDLTGQIALSQSLGALFVGGVVTGTISATVDGTSGDDVFVVSVGLVTRNGATVFTGALTNLTVNGVGGQTALIVNDQSADAGLAYTVTASTLSRTEGATAFADVAYQGIASLELDGSNQGATYMVAGTAVPTKIVSNGPSYVTVGDAGRTTKAIAAPVNVTNPTGATIVIVDDSYDSVGRSVTLSDGRVTGLSPADVTWTATPPGTFTGVARLILDGGSGDNTFNVLDTDTFYQYAAIAPGTGASNNTVNVHATTAPLYVYGNGGTDLVTVGSGAAGAGGSLADIRGSVNVIGYGGVTSLVVDDQGSTTQEVYEVFASEVDRNHLPDAQGNYVPDMAPITYTGLNSLALYASTSSYNLLYIEGTAAGTRTDIYGGRNNSTPSQITVNEFVVSGGPGDTLDDILGPLNLHGRTTSPGGESLVILNDSSTVGGRTYTLTAGGISRTAMAPITFDNMVYDELYTSETAGAAINVQGVAATGATIVIAGAGDPVTVGSPDPSTGGNTLAAIQGPLVIDAGYINQVPSVVIDDSDDLADHAQATISSDSPYYDYQLTGLAPAPIYFGLTPTTPVSIRGGRGNDTFTVTGPVSYTGIAIGGGGGINSLTYEDQTTTPVAIYTITANTVARAGSGPIAYANMAHLSLYAGGQGRNVIYVESTQARTMTDVYGGSTPYVGNDIGLDEFLVGDPNSGMDGIQGPVALHGLPGTFSLTSCQDFDNSTPALTYTLTAGGLNRTGIAPITFEGMVYDAIGTNEPGAIINVLGTAPNVTTYVGARAGDSVTVGSPTAGAGTTLADILGPLVIVADIPSASSGLFPVVIDDSGDMTNHPNAAISSDAADNEDYQLTGLAPAPISFRINPASPISIRGGLGNDTCTVAGPVSYTGITIDGGGGNNTLIYDDQATAASETYTVTANTIGETGAGSIGYANMANLAVYAGSGTVDVVNVNSTAPGTTTDVYGGTTNSQAPTEDVLYVGNGLLDAVKGPVALHGRTGLTIVGFGDWANAQAGQTYNLTAGALKRPGKAPITYDGLIYYDGLATSQSVPAVVNVQSNGNLPTYIGMGPGDAVTFGSQPPALGGTLAQIQGSIFLRSYGYVPGLPSIVVDDSGDSTAHPNVALSAYPAPDNLQLNDYQLTGLAPATITFEWSLDRATPIRILGGLANDTFTVANPVSFTGITVDGGGGANTLVGPTTANTWTISGGNMGTLGSVAFAAMQSLVGGSASDVFKFQASGSLGGTIDGGAGVNLLDYSAYKGGITVDLALHLASLVNNRAIDSVFNVQNVTGSQGNDMLVGDTNANVFIAGTGRNVLIGGAGADTLDASASQGDNILIGASTDWDKNIQALDAIMAEWTRTDLNSKSSFQSRYNDLINGAGTTNPLNVLTVNGQRTLILLTPATNPKSNNGTIPADGALDTLKGTNLTNPTTGARAHNWFFYDDADAALVNFLNSDDHKNHTT
jgi:hypothetical protein